MPEIQKKKYDLEDRTLEFAKKIKNFIDKLPKSTSNLEISRQLMRSGGSIGANYIEANESLGKKDFLMKIRICSKEAKETRYWLKLLDEKILSEEAMEYMRIFGSILEKFKI